MTRQPDLFAWAPYGGHPPSVDRETSRLAAEAIEPQVTRLRRVVLDFITLSGGATDEQMQSAIPMAANTQRPRRCELVEMSLVRDSGRTRRTKSGRQAVVWEVAR